MIGFRTVELIRRVARPSALREEWWDITATTRSHRPTTWGVADVGRTAYEDIKLEE